MSDNLFPTMHSLLSSHALLDFVSKNYNVGRVTCCEFLTRGLNDTYHVTTERDVFILRVYRTHWRTREDIAYELDVLEHLHRNGISVSTPVRTREGELMHALDAAEGTRHVVLFTFAKGTIPRLDQESSYEYGKTVAQIHNVTDEFSSPHKRFNLDLNHLLDLPLKKIAPAIAKYGGDFDYVMLWVDKIRNGLPIELLDKGFCHGDFHDWNAHWNDGILTIFDFDCCGHGYRSYDIAVFLWNLKRNYQAKETESWKAFLRGYAEQRPLQQVDLDAVPLWVAARRIWLAGIYLSNEDVWGTAMINDRFFKSFIDQLKEDENNLTQ